MRFVSAVNRTFIFFHHEPFGPISLASLHAGKALFGGSVARLRLLFTLVRREHDVYLVGNVEAGEFEGVKAIPAIGPEFLPALAVRHPAVLVFNNPPPEKVWAEFSARRSPNLRTVIWAGNHYEQQWADRLTRREIDRIVCVSRWHRDCYRTQRGFERIEVSYSGIDKDLLCPRGIVEPNTVISLSVPRRTKGFDRLVAAWRIVRASNSRAVLIVSGAARMHAPGAPLGATGTLDADIEAEFPDIFHDGAISRDAAGIRLMGARPLAEVHESLSRAAVAVVNPGHGSPETYCRAAVEAQAAGVPVVGAWSGSLPEVVADERTGILCRDDSPETIAGAILRLLNEPDLARTMGHFGPAWANWLADYDLIAPDWEGIAERADNDRPAPAEPRAMEDRLRELGYGQLRSWLRAALPSSVRRIVKPTKAFLS